MGRWTHHPSGCRPGKIPYMKTAIMIEWCGMAMDRPSPHQQEQLLRQLTGRGRRITRPEVLEAMLAVPRHAFVPSDLQPDAYRDHPLPIGFGQTISQPYIVALMTQLLEPGPDDRVLEIGPGCGYQSAVLSRLVKTVHGVEIVPELARTARETLAALGIANVHIHDGDGYHGWPDAAPYDSILVACSPDHIPADLVDQLKPGGRMILPLGRPDEEQELWSVTRDGDQLVKKRLLEVRFVPMTGDARRGG